MWAFTLHLLAIARGVTLGKPRLCPNPAENSVTCRHLVHVQRIPGGSCRIRTCPEHRITQGIPPKISADNLPDSPPLAGARCVSYKPRNTPACNDLAETSDAPGHA